MFLLKSQTGGEMYFSDVYADRDLPEDIRKHKVLWGMCWYECYLVKPTLFFK